MKRKLFLMLVSICLLFQSAPFESDFEIPATAETIPINYNADGSFGFGDTSIGYFCFRSLSESTAELIYWTPPRDTIPDRIVIPSEVDGKRVTSMSNQARCVFYYAPAADPEDKASVQRIEALKKIDEIVVPEGVTNIGDGAFSYVLAKKVTLPSTIKTIGEKAFYGAYITEVNIPNGVTSIGERAFSACNKLQNITLPYTLSNVGDCVCAQCDNLVSANIQCCYASNKPKAMFSGCKNLKNVTLAADFTEIYERTFFGCESLENISIPDKVTALGHSAFYGCKNLKSISFSGDVRIGIQSFYECYGLESITITGNIEPASLMFCKSLKTVKIGPNVDNIKMVNVFTFSDNLQNIEVDPTTRIMHHMMAFCITRIYRI